MMNAVLTSILFLAAASTSPSPELLNSVQTYWNHLAKGDKSSALSYVLAQSHSNFLRRREPPFRSWKVAGATLLDDNSWRVRVTVDRWLRDGTYSWPVIEEWRLVEGSWRVRIPNQTHQARQLWQKTSPQRISDGKLQVLPASLKFHILDRSRQAALTVRNGTNQLAQVAEIYLDPLRFEVLQAPESIAPGSASTILIQYRGSETEKELESRLTIVLREGSRERRIDLPILYNHLSPGARALFELHSEEAQQLKADDNPAPQISVPSPGREKRSQPVLPLPPVRILGEPFEEPI